MKGVRFCTITAAMLLLLAASGWPQAGVRVETAPATAAPARPQPGRPPAPPEADNAARQRRNELQTQANRLIQQGQFQQAMRLLEGLATNRQETGPLLQLLDLQVRLKDEEGARRSMDSLALRLPAHEVLKTWSDFQVAGALAGARYRLGQPARAAELWKQMKEQALSEDLALAVFHSYRQVRLLDEALAWAVEQRRKAGREDLWAFELAQLHEEAGRPREAFDELARWQCRQQGGGPQVADRLLTLSESASDRESLLRYMLKRLENRRESCPPLGEAVLGVLVQQGWVDEAAALSWRLDTDQSGVLPYDLAADLSRDGRATESQALLEELARQGRPQAAQPEFVLLQAGNLAALGRPEEALALYRRLAGQRGAKSNLALLRAAELLHKPLGRIPEAIVELEDLMAHQATNLSAGRLLAQLLGCQGDTTRAREVLRAMAGGTRATEEQRTELAWLGIRLDWWAGNLGAGRTGLGAFLKTNTRQDAFNDAIELMDLLAFATTDSLTVVEAARADRLAFAGEWRQALDLLHALAEQSKPKLAEWLDWRACLLAEQEMAPDALRAEFRRYRARQPKSVRLDRLAWMELLASEREGLPRDSLRAQGLALLETWPQSLLQDAVRRRLREWDPAAVPPEAPVAAPVEKVMDGPPR